MGRIPLFTSKVFLGALGYVLVSQIQPAIGTYIESGKWTPKETRGLFDAAIILVAQGLLRYSDGDSAYTPKFLPGRNKEG